MNEPKNKMKVLVVDDNRDLSSVMVEKFTESGFEADSASNGKEGLEKALDTHPDIILLDLVMPVMDGLGMLEELRKDDWGKDVKVMILSLLNQPDVMADAIDGNIRGYIVKTDLSLDEVVERVTTVLNE